MPIHPHPRRSLYEFTRDGWHVLEPGNPFIDNWHIHAMDEHLEAVARGEIRNLIILVPPRFQKSLSAAVFFPVWVWAEINPAFRWIFGSYSQEFAFRDSVKCRDLICSPWFQSNYGDRFSLKGDQNQKSKFENDKTGYRIATSVGGGGTGEGADCIVADDAHKVGEAESPVKRAEVLRWWNETMATRGNDPKTVRKIIVMQRVHQNDLAGDQIDRNLGYEVLRLPMKYEIEEKKRATIIGFTDPRTQEGELLWPERFPLQEVNELERSLGPYATAGQFQQRPAPREGGMFKRSWFEIIEHLPPVNIRWVRYWDKAFTEGGGAYTAGGLQGICNKEIIEAEKKHIEKMFYLADIVRGQWDPGTRNEIILQTAIRDRAKYGNVLIVIEQEPGPMGKDANRVLIAKLAGFSVQSDIAREDKTLRAEPLAAQTSIGNFKLLRGEWNESFLDEITMFPFGKYKDQVDMASGGFNKLLKLGAPSNLTTSQLRSIVNR